MSILKEDETVGMEENMRLQGQGHTTHFLESSVHLVDINSVCLIFLMLAGHGYSNILLSLSTNLGAMSDSRYGSFSLEPLELRAGTD